MSRRMSTGILQSLLTRARQDRDDSLERSGRDTPESVARAQSPPEGAVLRSLALLMRHVHHVMVDALE